MITAIRLEQFRSYGQAEFALDPATTVVVGPNGSGKTNLLEALYVLATTKSFRARDEALVARGESHYRIEATTGKDSLAVAYLQSERGSQKRLLHGRAKRTLRDHVGTLPVVLFEPNDLTLLTGPPKPRRRYMDHLLSQTSGDYLMALVAYNRAIKQRNSLLKRLGGVSSEELFVWNMRLVQPALVIRRHRAALMNFLASEVPRIYNQVADRKHTIELSYLPSPVGATEVTEEALLELVTAAESADRAAGFSTVGPHRDDFTVRFDGKPMDQVASRGEQRTMVLSCKLAELTYQQKQSSIPPLLLLDDVFSELDTARRRALLAALEGHQTIITTTEADALGDGSYYTITLERRHD